MNSKPIVKYIDLFSGTGGIRLGFTQSLEQLGIKHQCIKSSEIDKRACETYELNFKENPYEDICNIDIKDSFDVLLAGFPCQSFSYAGKQRGFADTRGTLFFEVEKLIKKHKPKVCFLENVRGLTTHDNGRTFKTIIDKLHKLGYNTYHLLLNSSNYNVPQNRVRIYIIALLGKIPSHTLHNDLGAKNSHDFKNFTMSLFNQESHKLVRDILEDNPSKKYDCSPDFTKRLFKVLNGDLNKLHGIRLIDTRNGNSIHSWEIGIKGTCTKSENEFMNLLIANRRKHIFGTHQDGKALTKEQIITFYKNQNINKVIHSLKEKGYLSEKNKKFNPVCGNMSFEVFKFLDPNSISITLTASDTHKLGIYHKGRVRHLTPRECARLQGYSDNYILHPIDTCAYKQMGNAVSIPVISEIFTDFILNNSVFKTTGKIRKPISQSTYVNY